MPPCCFLPRNNINLFRTPDSGIASVGSTVTVWAQVYEDVGAETPAIGIPLSMQVYAPDYSSIGTYTSTTNNTGMARFDFPISLQSGDNSIMVSNDDLGGLIKTTDFMGRGGTVRNIILNTVPSYPVYADGTSSYLLRMWAQDSGGNPVDGQDIQIVKNGDFVYAETATTNAYGYAEMNLGASNNVHNDVITVSTTNYAGGNTTYVNNTTTVSYIAGLPTHIELVANPNVVASRNITTPPGMADVHNTTIVAMVMDQWEHPIDKEPVTITSLNSTLGNMSAPYSGFTHDGGEFDSQFSLGYAINDSDMTIGAPILATCVNASQGVNLSSTTNVLYTNSPYLTVNSTINPRSNIAVNDKINASITIKAIGWKTGVSTKSSNYSIEMIFDSSGSMDWLSTTIYPTNGEPLQNTMSDDGAEHLIGTYPNDGTSPIQIMLSSPYRNFDNDSYYYNLHVIGPNGYNKYGTRSNNENYLVINSAVAGSYKIYGMFNYGGAQGGYPQYSSMVLKNPTRLGDGGAMSNSAAKLAASSFIDGRTGDQVGIVWFNDTQYDNYNRVTCPASGIAKTLTVVNTATRPSFNVTLSSLNANAGTNIGAGIQKARDDFNNSIVPASNKRIAIILSDGYSQHPDQDIAQARAANKEGITIYTIGMGMPDEATLQSIAYSPNLSTNGTYTKVVSDVGLTKAYQIISDLNSNNLTDVAAVNSQLMVVTNCSVAYGPDTEYVPGSARVAWPNGTISSIEPTIIDNGTWYSLYWAPGNLTFNDTWTVHYQLNVSRAGLLLPISNQSSVSFDSPSSDGSGGMITTTEHFGNGAILTNNTTNMTPMGQPLNPVLNSPKTGDILNTTSSQINWSVTYTVADGNYYTYAQYRKVGDIAWNNLGVKGPYSANMTISMAWNTGILQNGDYEVQAKAYDGTYTGESEIHVSR